MRIVLDLTAAAGDHIEGTASWADLGKPVAFYGWLALMRLLEDAQRSTGGDGTPIPTTTAPADCLGEL
jgi:hypothetical protein